MLGSPRTPLALLEQQLQTKITEIAGIKRKLQAEMKDREDVLVAKQQLRSAVNSVSQVITAVRHMLKDLKQTSIEQIAKLLQWISPVLTEQFQKVRRADQKQILRLTTELCRVNAQHKHIQQGEALAGRRQSSDSEHKKISQFIRQQDQPIALKRCDVTSPANRDFGQQLGASPALEIPCIQLQTINEEEQSSQCIQQNTKAKVKVKSSVTGIHLTRTQPTEQYQAPIPIPTVRAESQRQEIKLKDLNKVCIEDLAKMIDKVTPSKIVIKGVVEKIQRRQSCRPDEMTFSEFDEDRENKWHKTTISQQNNFSKNISVIELGNKKRSLSKENAHSRERSTQLSELKPVDQNLQKSQSREKIKVTVKDNKLDQSRSRSISRPERKNSYSNHSTTANQTNTRGSFVQARSHLVEQLSKMEFCTGDRRYELRFEGSKKQNSRCGNGRLEYINGLVYEGEFREDMRHGYGVLSFNGREIYSGNWQSDQMSGRGVLKNFHCICRRKLPEQSLLRTSAYEGQFRNNSIHGRGILTFQSGQRFEGYFHNNVPQGELTLVERSFCLETSQFQL